MPESFWLPMIGADPTNPVNWVNNQQPKAGDDVFIPGTAMLLIGTTLDGTTVHLGTDGKTIPLPGALVEMLGGSNLKVQMVGAADQGNHVRIDAFGKNTIDLTANGSGDPVHPTKTSLEINVADNSVLTGRFDATDMAVSINAAGPHSTFDHEGASHLNNTYIDGINDIKIMPDMIGSGIFRMTFAQMEVGGFVAPTQFFDMVNAGELIVDHADQFKGVISWNEANISDMVMKDFTIASDSVVGDQFTATSTDGRTAQFTVKFNAAETALTVRDAPDGSSILSNVKL